MNPIRSLVLTTAMAGYLALPAIAEGSVTIIASHADFSANDFLDWRAGREWCNQ